MDKKNEISGRIINVGDGFNRFGNNFVGLPALGDFRQPVLIDNNRVCGQFVLDENGYYWARINFIEMSKIMDPKDPAHTGVEQGNYPLTFRIFKQPFSWTGYGNTYPYTRDHEAGPGFKAFSVDVVGTVWIEGLQTYVGNFGGLWNKKDDPAWRNITVEEAKKGITVSTDQHWTKFAHKSELKPQPDGIHVFFSGVAVYDVEDKAVYPACAEIVLSFREVPFDYYPCSMYNTTDNKFVSCNDPKHSFTMFDGSSFRDIKNFEYDTAGEPKGLMYYNNKWNKIMKG